MQFVVAKIVQVMLHFLAIAAQVLWKHLGYVIGNTVVAKHKMSFLKIVLKFYSKGKTAANGGVIGMHVFQQLQVQDWVLLWDLQLNSASPTQMSCFPSNWRKICTPNIE